MLQWHPKKGFFNCGILLGTPNYRIQKESEEVVFNFEIVENHIFLLLLLICSIADKSPLPYTAKKGKYIDEVGGGDGL